VQLQYNIAITGEQAIARALASTERRFIRHNRTVARTLGGPAAGVRPGKVGDETAKLARAAQSLDRQRSQALFSQFRQKERLEQRSHQQALKNVEREAKARQRAGESLDRQRSRSLMAQYRQQEREAKKNQNDRRRFLEGAFGKVGSSVRGSLSAVGALGGAALGLGGGFALSSAIQQQMGESAAASKLANQAGKPELKGQLLKEAQGVKGFTGEETLGAMSGFVAKTGDLQAARGLINDLGKLALATGTDFGEMGEAAGQAFNVIKDTIPDSKEQLKAVNDVMRSLAQQGNLGAVEIKDMVTELAGLGAATRKFEGGPVQLIKTAGAMAQAAVARGGAESADEATTAVTRFSDDIIKNTGGAFDKAGINRFTDKSRTKLRGPEDLMLDILDKSGGDLTKINDMFGIYAQRAVGGFAPLYTDAEKKQKGSGRAAVKAEFAKYANATVSSKDIEARANSRLDDADLRFKEVMKDFNARIGGELLPVVTELIPKFAKLLPYVDRAAELLGKMVAAFAEDPFAGVAKIVAAKLAFDVAVSGLGTAASKLTDSISGAASKIGGAGNGINGALGAAGLGAQLGMSVATMIVTASVVNFEKGEADIKDSGAALNRARALEEISKTQALTPEQQAQLKADQELVGKHEADAKKQSMLESILSTGLGAAAVGGSLIAGGAALAPAGLSLAKQSDKAADALVHPSRQTEINSQSGISSELEKIALSIDKNTAALAHAAPNRTDAPSVPRPTGK
jgi:hypothetical protein